MPAQREQFFAATLTALTHSLVAGALLVGAGTATWLSLHGGVTPVGPIPLGWYALLWLVTLMLAVVVGVGEKRLA